MMKKRILSILLVVVMCLTMIPTTAFAADTLTVGDTFEAVFKNVPYKFTVLEAATDSANGKVEISGLSETNTYTDITLNLNGTVTDENGASYIITAVGEKAFQNCTILTDVSFMFGNVTTIGDYAFAGCTGLKSINFSLTPVTHIGNSAFYNCTNLETCTLNNSNLVSIGMSAFENCQKVKTISLQGSQISSIGDGAFLSCLALESVDLRSSSSSLTLGDAAFALSRFGLSNCLKEITIPGTVESIPMMLFAGRDQLVTLTLEPGVKKIEGPFALGCRSLTNLIIPEGVEEMEWLSWESGGSDFVNLEQVVLPSTIQKLVETFKQRCVNLKRVEFAGGEAPKYYYSSGTAVEGTFEDNFPSHLHELIVKDGMGDGAYAAGETVTLSYTGTGEFVEWKVTSGDATINGNTLTMGSAHSTVIPILTSYTITYDANGGDSYWLPGNMTAKYGEQIVLPERQNLMNKDNADFQGWMIEGTLYQPGDKYTVTGHVTVYAHWLSYFKLWFIEDQTTGRRVTKYAYEPDYQFTLPECDYEIYEIPEGKNFKAWLVGNVEYKAGETITLTENYYVYPVWEDAVTGTVTFSPGDEDATGSVEPITVEAGKTITLPECGFTPTNDNILFYGWKINGANYKPGAEYLVTSDVIAEAIWSNRHYTITFDANGGTGSMEPMYAFRLDNYSITMPQCGFTPPEGYRFSCWEVSWEDGSIVRPLPGSYVQFRDSITVKAIYVTVSAGTVASVTTEDGQTTTYHTDINAAINAAKANSGSTLKLLDAIDTDKTVTIDSGSFTIDLNGKWWYSFEDVLQIEGTDTNITITDSMQGGTLSAGGLHAIHIRDGSVKINGGTIHGEIGYENGELDLSGHNDPAGIYIYTLGGKDDSEKRNIILPKGYVLFVRYEDEVVTEPKWGFDYEVDKDPNAPTTYAVTVNPAANGTVKADKTTAAEGETVNLTVTPDEGYVLDTLTVGGNDVTAQVEGATYTFTMPAEDVTVTATFKVATTSEIISVNITWGAMSFTYTDGEWNPETHTYGEGEWTPDDENGNVITVTNNGNVAVTVSLSYENAEGYSFTGTFDTSSATLAAGDNKTFTLTLNGKPTESMTAEVIGTVTVKIEEGGE